MAVAVRDLVFSETKLLGKDKVDSDPSSSDPPAPSSKASERKRLKALERKVAEERRSDTSKNREISQDASVRSTQELESLSSEEEAPKRIKKRHESSGKSRSDRSKSRSISRSISTPLIPYDLPASRSMQHHGLFNSHPAQDRDYQSYRSSGSNGVQAVPFQIRPLTLGQAFGTKPPDHEPLQQFESGPPQSVRHHLAHIQENVAPESASYLQPTEYQPISSMGRPSLGHPTLQPPEQPSHDDLNGFRPEPVLSENAYGRSGPETWTWNQGQLSQLPRLPDTPGPRYREPSVLNLPQTQHQLPEEFGLLSSHELAYQEHAHVDPSCFDNGALEVGAPSNFQDTCQVPEDHDFGQRDHVFDQASQSWGDIRTSIRRPFTERSLNTFYPSTRDDIYRGYRSQSHSQRLFDRSITYPGGASSYFDIPSGNHGMQETNYLSPELYRSSLDASVPDTPALMAADLRRSRACYQRPYRRF